jgi:hypothetical protein
MHRTQEHSRYMSEAPEVLPGLVSLFIQVDEHKKSFGGQASLKLTVLVKSLNVIDRRRLRGYL